jgi:hypothetical protein
VRGDRVEVGSDQKNGLSGLWVFSDGAGDPPLGTNGGERSGPGLGDLHFHGSDPVSIRIIQCMRKL